MAKTDLQNMSTDQLSDAGQARRNLLWINSLVSITNAKPKDQEVVRVWSTATDANTQIWWMLMRRRDLFVRTAQVSTALQWWRLLGWPIQHMLQWSMAIAESMPEIASS